MFARACKYAQDLDIHNLDGDSEHSYSHGLWSDDDRRGFWQLVQCDLYFRLIYNKSPTITAKAWKVDLPWMMSVDSQSPPIQTVSFLVNSRITMILIDFFTLIEDQTLSPDDLGQRTEDLCLAVRTSLLEWQLVRLMNLNFLLSLECANKVFLKDELFATTHTRADSFIIFDTLANGYFSIIFMLYRLKVLGSSSWSVKTDADLPMSSLAIDAARDFITLITKYITLYPDANTMSETLGFTGSHVPIAYIYYGALHTAEVGSEQSDLSVIQDFSQSVIKIARKQCEYQPLIRALDILNREIQEKL